MIFTFENTTYTLEDRFTRRRLGSSSFSSTDDTGTTFVLIFFTARHKLYKQYAFSLTSHNSKEAKTSGCLVPACVNYFNVRDYCFNEHTTTVPVNMTHRQTSCIATPPTERED